MYLQKQPFNIFRVPFCIYLGHSNVHIPTHNLLFVLGIQEFDSKNRNLSMKKCTQDKFIKKVR